MDKIKKVAVLFSGGVDSVVATKKMQEQGFLDVADVASGEVRLELFFMKTDFFSDNVLKKAEESAKILGLKLNIIDLSAEFQQSVIEYFKKEYQNNRTPNPCVMCNKAMKFGLLYSKIRKLGFGKIVTGHHVKNFKFQISNFKNNDDPPSLKLRRGKANTQYQLLKAVDKKKDQSYFLYNLRQEQLQYLEFPVGGMQKSEVVKIAKELGIPSADEESQDICFLKGDHNKFLQEHLNLKSGPIKNKSGEILGEHFGLPLYTIGQRRWIKIGGTGPYYVLRKDVAENTLYVTDSFDDPDLYADKFTISDVNWISDEAPKSEDLAVKVRYLHPAVDIKSIEKKENGEYNIVLKEKQRAITIGQSAVVYRGDRLLGGGVIC